MSIVVGIDLGTQSTKIIAYDVKNKKIVGHGQATYNIIIQEDGTREQKVAWWEEAIISCFHQLDKDVRDNIIAIGVSGQQHGLVALDENGEVLRNVKLWNDTSTTNEAEDITLAAGGAENLLNSEGNLVLPGYTAPKILHLKRHWPELYNRLRWILLPHDWVNYFLTDSLNMEYGDASGTGLLDVKTKTWSKRLLKIIDSEKNLVDVFPPLIDAYASAGRTSAKTSKLLRIPQGIFVSSGGGDNMMGAIGTNVVESGKMAVSLGTSGTIFASSSTPIIDPKGRLAAFCSSTGSYLPLLCTMNCTVTTELTRTLFSKSIQEFEELALQSPIGANGITFLPYFNGERTPNYPHGRGCIMGLSMENMNKTTIARAAMESAILSLNFGLDAFREQGVDPRQIHLIGGGANSAVWPQMAADVFNVEIRIPAVKEAAAFGSALQAWWGYLRNTGTFICIEEVTDEHVNFHDENYKPISTNTKQYELVYQNYLKYASNMSELFS